jgi:Flp pilus assembly protein TadG
MTRKTQSGQALVFVALAMVVLLGFAGLSVDLGVLRHKRRLQQTAADAAAVVGANDLAYGAGTIGMTSGAQSAAATNGYTDASSNDVTQCASPSAAVGLVCVQVKNGPIYVATDPHLNDIHYVEVVVSTVQPTYFMKIFGVRQQTVLARAVATNLTGSGPGSSCMTTLGLPSKEIGVDINGHPTINAPTCGISDNGNFNTKGNSLTVNAGSFAVSGTTNSSGPGGKVTCQYQVTCPSPGAPTVSDPFAGLTPPAVGTPVAWTGTPVPGTTYSGITINGGTVNFPPGMYIVSGSNFTCSGSPTITGTGVTFFFTNGATINCTGSANINLTAPTPTNCPSCDRKYDGILMYQDPADTSTGIGNACPPGNNKGPQLGGNDQSQYNGVLYFPADQLWLFGNTGTISYDVLISDSICLSGNATFSIAGAAGLPVPIPVLSNAVLVE